MYNIDSKTGIRYGVIQANYVGAWHKISESEYPTPYDCGVGCTCRKCGGQIAIPESANWSDTPICDCGGTGDIEDGDCLGPVARNYCGGGYEATQGGGDHDIFVILSPYFTYAPLCSFCAPGACYLTSDPDVFIERHDGKGEKCYCFGHDWFWDTELKSAPYTVYSVETGEIVLPDSK